MYNRTEEDAMREEAKQHVDTLRAMMEEATSDSRLVKSQAKQCRMLYDSLKDEGFNPEQALVLVVASLRAGK